MTIIKVYQLSNVTSQSILYKFYVNLKPWKWCGLSELLEYLQMFDIKGKKGEGSITVFLYFTSFIRFECFSKRPVLKVNAWNPEENVVSVWVPVTVLLYLNVPVYQLVFCNWFSAAKCFSLIPVVPVLHSAQEKEGNEEEVNFVSHKNES